MVVTSFTTACAFTANLLSEVPVVRSFALLMSLLVVINLSLALTAWPVLIAVWAKHVARRERACARWLRWLGAGAAAYLRRCCAAVAPLERLVAALRWCLWPQSGGNDDRDGSEDGGGMEWGAERGSGPLGGGGGYVELRSTRKRTAASSMPLGVVGPLARRVSHSDK